MNGKTDNAALAHGVEDTRWNNLGKGWQIECVCGWMSGCAPIFLSDTAEEFDQHLAEQNSDLTPKVKPRPTTLVSIGDVQGIAYSDAIWMLEQIGNGLRNTYLRAFNPRMRHTWKPWEFQILTAAKSLYKTLEHLKKAEAEAYPQVLQSATAPSPRPAPEAEKSANEKGE